MRYALQAAGGILALATLAEAGMYGQPVVNLDAKTFSKAMATEHAAMVAFVAPWCGHCKNLAPEYTAAASSLSPLIPFYAIDCDDAGNKQLCAEQQIKGFPTIKAFPRAGKGAARDYNGERKRGALVEYAKELVPDRVKKLRADDGAEKVVSKFLSEMHLGYIRDTKSHDILSFIGAYEEAETASETVRAVVWPAGASDSAEIVVYDGQLKFNALLEWLQLQLSPRETGGAPKAKQNPLKASGSEPSPAAADDTAARRAQQQAKLDEAERRDAARRKKAAGAHYHQSADASDDAPSSTDDAPPPRAAEGVADEAERGPNESSEDAALPSPGGDEEKDVEATETSRTHEDL